MLLQTRLSVLARATQATGVMGLNLSEDVLAQQFDVIVLCHTLRGTERVEVVRRVRQQWPNAKLLSISRHDEHDPSDDADAQVRALGGPDLLLRAVHRLLRGEGEIER